MTSFGPNAPKVRIAFLTLLTAIVSILFLGIIRSLFMSLLMAVLFAEVTRPLYRRLVALFREHRGLASALTVLLSLCLVIVPILLFMGVLADQALDISQTAGIWLKEHAGEYQIKDIPGLERLVPYQKEIMTKAGQLAATAGTHVARWVAAGARGTVDFLLMLFIMLYAMFNFLIHGRSLLDKILDFTPLTPDDRGRLVRTFTSVSQATLKGTLVIGIVQGGLAGLAFAVAGVKGTLFWSAVMAVMSIIPGIGSALVWLPTAIFLALTGRTGASIGVGLWCAVVAGSADNFLRPVLVGKGARMPDLLVFVTTMGGLLLFGASGIIIGPLIGAMFVTVWELLASSLGKEDPSGTQPSSADRRDL